MEKGTQIKQYRILSRLGEGGMGVVYKAEDTRLGRTVALKVLPEHLAESEDHLRRFEREARTASAINHPGIATLYDFDQEDGKTFLSMEYVAGQTLRELVDQNPLTLPQLLDCLHQVSVALAAAHHKGIIHRDLKPENVMASESGFYKILDFGLARLEMRDDLGFSSSSPTQWATVSRQLTNEGKIVGTFAYMSPEQVQGHALDPRSDIFSFGILIYEMVTGTLPFRGNNSIASFHAIVHEDPAPMSSLREGAPAELERIALKCLAKNPAERYQTAADLAVDLRALQRTSDTSGSYSSAPAYPLPRPRPKRQPGLKWIVGTTVAVLGALALAAWLIPWGNQSTVNPAAPASRAAPLDAVANARTSHNRIVVTRFSNVSGDPEADWLRQALPEMLTTDLARTQGLEIISTQRMDDLAAAAGRREGENLDQATSTELARWAGAGIVVSGSVFTAGDGYRIDVQASDTGSGEVLHASRAEGTDVFAMADQLSRDLRQGLEIQTETNSGIQAVTTSSQAAYRHYTAGMKLYQDLHLSEATAAFQAAVEADPGFALAQLRLGLGLFLEGETAKGLEWIQAAREQADRIPERERMLAEGFDMSFQEGDFDAGEERFQAIAVKYPEDVESLFWSAQARVALQGDRMAALQRLQEALERDPDSSLAVAGMAAHLRDLKLEDEAQIIVREFLGRHQEMSEDRMHQVEVCDGPPEVSVEASAEADGD